MMLSTVLGLAVVCTTSADPDGMADNRALSRQTCRNCVVSEHAEHHDVGRAPASAASWTGVRTQLLEVMALLGRSAQCADVVAGLHKTRHHGAAHPPGSDEADPHRGWPIRFSVASAASSTAPPWVPAASARSTTSRTSFCSSVPATPASGPGRRRRRGR